MIKQTTLAALAALAAEDAAHILTTATALVAAHGADFDRLNTLRAERAAAAYDLEVARSDRDIARGMHSAIASQKTFYEKQDAESHALQCAQWFGDWVYHHGQEWDRLEALALYKASAAAVVDDMRDMIRSAEYRAAWLAQDTTTPDQFRLVFDTPSGEHVELIGTVDQVGQPDGVVLYYLIPSGLFVHLELTEAEAAALVKFCQIAEAADLKTY